MNRDGDKVVLVDAEDTAIGTAGKLEAHRRGLRHRAVSALVRNQTGDLLLQRRSATKYHSGGLWANACCSHPLPGESADVAVRRRLKEEMGFACTLEKLFTYSYRANVSDGLIENEIVHVFGGWYDGPIKPDPAEVSEWKWLDYDSLVLDIAANPDDYAIWFRQYMSAHGGLIAGWTALRR